MIEHPVPQNVTGYQFHLVGDMTLKQFLELAGGIGMAWLFWTLALPLPIKIVLSVGSAMFGAALAFLPVEDRPLDQWVIAFFKAIYRPTLFRWKKTIREDLLQFKPRPKEKQHPLATASKAPAARLQSLLQMYELEEQEEGKEDPLEKEWVARQQQIPQLFRDVAVPKKLAQETTFPRQLPIQPTRPDTKVFVHPLSPPENIGAILRGEITLSSRQPRLPEAPSPQPTVETPPPVVPSVEGSLPTVQAPGAATHAAHAMMNKILLPVAPTIPNILTGMVFSGEGNTVENAIIEIRDQSGLPVRALKTNKIGQFSIATPLPNGTYDVAAEKEGLAFDILKIEAKGETIAPIEIKAKETGNKEQEAMHRDSEGVAQ